MNLTECIQQGYIEQWGSGIARIKSACKAQRLTEPRIREKGDFVDVEFYRPGLDSAVEVPDTERRMPDTHKKVPDTDEKMPDRAGLPRILPESVLPRARHLYK